MKTCLFLLLVLLCSVSAFGQQSDTLMMWRYADLTYPLGGFSTKAKVAVDYGDSVGWFKVPELLGEEDGGKAVKMKSPVDALNWMSARGWELVESYQTDEDIGFGTKLKYIHYIMRRMEPRKKEK